MEEKYTEKTKNVERGKDKSQSWKQNKGRSEIKQTKGNRKY